MGIKLAFRWFGEQDPIPLSYIAQIPGVKHIVSAVYDVPPGMLWPARRLESMVTEVAAHGLLFDVAESVPVHENIKLWRGDVKALLAVYKENIKCCASCGIRTITYNFMPVFDWTRTTLSKCAPDGSTSLALEREALAALDPMHTDLSLPGWDASYTKSELRELIGAYQTIGAAGVREHLFRFLAEIIPTAEACGVRMALHPDDPPYPIFGLPRIVRNEAALDEILAVINSPANALCLCTGSLGSHAANDVAAMVEKYAATNKIAFMHMRNILLSADGSFTECGHAKECGSVDLAKIAHILHSHGYDGHVRPDHGRMIWGEAGRPGYGLYDRALGASYLRGLFDAYDEKGRTHHVL